MKPVAHFDYFSSTRNIILIVFDAVPGSAIEGLLLQNELLQTAFKDFIFYPNAMSPSSQTSIALPSLAGNVSPLARFSKHQQLYDAAKEKTFLKTALANGFRVSLLLDQSYYLKHWGAEEAYDVRTVSALPEFSITGFLLKCSIRILPIGLQETTFDGLSQQLENCQYKITDKYFLEKLVQEAKSKSGQPAFFIWHTLLTHTPYLITENGDFSLSANGTSNMLFTMTRAMEFLKRLKTMGCYDNSLIIFCSDHGSPIGPYDDLLRSLNSEYKAVLSILANNYLPVSNYNPFIMIKYPQAENAKIVVDRSDVMNTSIYAPISAYLAAENWNEPALRSAFKESGIPMGVRLFHQADNKSDQRNRYNFLYLQSFAAPEGIRSLSKIFETLEPAKIPEGK
jgi:hypothetical protein